MQLEPSSLVEHGEVPAEIQAGLGDMEMEKECKLPRWLEQLKKHRGFPW